MTKIKSVSEFISAVSLIQQNWTNEDTHFIYPWFRGHADESYPLLPGIYRNDEEDEGNEENYRHDFLQKGFPFLADTAFGTPMSEWEWYFLMQHYGVPTRLLDWSVSLREVDQRAIK